MYEKRLNIPISTELYDELHANVERQKASEFVRQAIEEKLSKLSKLSTYAHLHKKRKKSIVK